MPAAASKWLQIGLQCQWRKGPVVREQSIMQVPFGVSFFLDDDDDGDGGCASSSQSAMQQQQQHFQPLSASLRGRSYTSRSLVSFPLLFFEVEKKLLVRGRK